MAFRILKAATPELMVRQLGGMITGKRIITGGRDNRPNPDVTPGHDLFKHPVAGLTLIFTTPAVTVTFSAAALDFKEIMEEIEATVGMEGLGHLFKTDPNGGSILAFWDDTAMVMSEAGTANAYFGFPTDAAHPGLTQVVVDPTDIVALAPDPLSKQWVAIIND